jgi:uncharacterized membrane protein (UPF0127 family)
MQKEDPAIWSYLDGWASHSYPNPGFSAKPSSTGWKSITSYRTALTTLHVADKPVFITETGWDQTKVNERSLDSYWRQAFIKWNQDSSVVAVTPFVLQGGNQFAPLSLLSTSGDVQTSGRTIKDIGKVKGSPVLAGPQPTPTPQTADDLGHVTLGDNISLFHTTSVTLHIENFFRKLIGLLPKQVIHIGTAKLTVELAENAATWEKGLSDRPLLDPDTGMLFVFPRLHIPLFWMKDMKFPLDIIWIADNTVVGIDKNVPIPDGGKLPTYSPKVPVDKVLEVPAGYSDNNGIAEGSELTLEQ